MEAATRRREIAVFGLLVLISLQTFCPFSFSSSSSGATSAINNAYLAVHNAQKNGGNVTSLIGELNVALALVQKAQAENSTSPSQATLDLENATQIALSVSSQSKSVSEAGSRAVQARDSESIISVAAIIIIAVLAYVYGGRIYARAWFYSYRNHVVKPRTNGGQRS